MAKIDFILSSYFNANVGSGYWIRKTAELLEKRFNVKYHSFKWKGPPKKHQRLSKNPFKLFKQLNKIFKGKNNIIIVPQFYTALLVGIISRLSGRHKKIIYGPYVFLIGDKDISKLKLHTFLEFIFFNLVKNKLFYVCSKTRQKTLLSKGIPKKNIILCNSGIELQDFTPTSKKEQDKLREKLDINQDDFVIGYVNRFDRIKDFGYFIRFIKNFNAEDIKFLIVGNVSPVNLNDKRVISTGFIDREKLNRIYSIMDLFINTSNFESFLLTKAEALSCGVPCVVPNLGATPEGIEKGINGFVYDKKHFNMFVKLVEKIKEDKKMHQKLKANSRSTAKKNFNWDKNIKPLVEACSRLNKSA